MVGMVGLGLWWMRQPENGFCVFRLPFGELMIGNAGNGVTVNKIARVGKNVGELLTFHLGL